jgi:hypothetical protein
MDDLEADSGQRPWSSSWTLEHWDVSVIHGIRASLG